MAEALVCLQAQGIDNDDRVVGRVRWARGLSNNDRGIGRGGGIDNASEGSETTTEAASIWERRRRLRHRNERPEELATIIEALAEEDETEVSTITMET